MSRSCLNGNVKLLPDELCHCQHVVVAGVGAIYAATNGRYDQPSMTRSRATNADTNETVSHPRQYDGHRTLDGGWVIRESWIKVWGRSYNKSGDVEKRLLFTLNYMERGEGAHHENVFYPTEAPKSLISALAPCSYNIYLSHEEIGGGIRMGLNYPNDSFWFVPHRNSTFRCLLVG